jgi:hypothetical protein
MMVKLLQPNHWGSKKHTTALEKGISENVFYLYQAESAYINEVVYANLLEGSILKTVPLDRFRLHYREKCDQYLTERAMRGNVAVSVLLSCIHL